MVDFLKVLDQRLTPVSGKVEAYIKGNNLDPTYLEPILKSTGNILVASCAGSGKTTALSLKVVKDSEIHSDIRQWVGTFLRKGASDLEHTVRTIDPSSTQVIRTLNSEFYQRWCTWKGYQPDIISDSDNLKLLKRVMEMKHLDLSRLEDLEQYLNIWFSGLHKERGIEHPPTYLGVVPPADIWASWRTLRQSAGKMSHDDIAYDLLELLQGGGVIPHDYTHIYLDEFQDVSRVQYEVLRLGYSSTVKVIVGDDDQSIYSWRGSDPSILLKDAPMEWGCKVFQLPVNYRCPSKIVTAVKPLIARNYPRLDKDLTASREGGDIHILRGGINHLGYSLAKHVRADLEEGKKVAILTRTNADILYPLLQVSKVSGAFLGLSTQGKQLTRRLDGLFSFFGVGRYSKYALGEFFRTVCGKPCYNFVDLSLKCGVHPLWGIVEIPIRDFQYSTPSLVRFVTYVKTLTWEDDLPAIGTLQNLRQVFIELGLGASMSQQHLLSYIDGLLSISQPSDTMGTLSSKVDMLTRSLPNTVDVDIELSTVHSYKGLESDSVYLWSATNGLFPERNASDIQEERRLFYIACTRAREKLTLMTWKDHPSPFLEELDVCSLDLESAQGILKSW